MKKFLFPLERLRLFRQMRLDQELGALEGLHAEAQALDLRRLALAVEENKRAVRLR